jgi:hypothetical protein
LGEDLFDDSKSFIKVKEKGVNKTRVFCCNRQKILSMLHRLFGIIKWELVLMLTVLHLLSYWYNKMGASIMRLQF